jgi:hypothetical protein
MRVKFHLRRGRSCVYYQRTRRWGIKLFTDREARDRTYSLCSWAAGNSLAPRVRLPFEARGCCGYAVEHCEATDATDDQLWLLSLKLRNLGLKTNDVNQRNTGLLRGSLSLFDFDLCYPLPESGATLKASPAARADGDILVSAATRRLSLGVPTVSLGARSRQMSRCQGTASDSER